jgi:hypothetical protein
MEKKDLVGTFADNEEVADAISAATADGVRALIEKYDLPEEEVYKTFAVGFWGEEIWNDPQWRD